MVAVGAQDEIGLVEHSTSAPCSRAVADPNFLVLVEGKKAVVQRNNKHETDCIMVKRQHILQDISFLASLITGSGHRFARVEAAIDETVDPKPALPSIARIFSL